jgi:serine phosphatase RsbU (regulator of sigma subunit)
MPALLVSDRDGESFTYDLGSLPVQIGRDKGNDLVLKDSTVSRFHAVLEGDHRGLQVRELGSRNRTYLNRRLVRGTEHVENGDCLLIGKTRIVFSDPRPSELQKEHGSGDAGIGWYQPDGHNFPTLPGKPPPCVSHQAELDLLRFLLESDRAVATHRPMDELFRTLLGLAQSVIPFDEALIALLQDQGGLGITACCPENARVDPFRLRKNVVEHVLRTQQPLVLEDVLSSSLASSGARSLICVPIRDDKRVVGILHAECRRKRITFDETHLRVLTHLANLAGFALENRRLLEETISMKLMRRDLDRAARIQREFLPARAPTITGYRIHAITRPCQQVGGDFFNYCELPNGCLGIAIGDVAGHGLDAALLMCSLQTSLSFCAEQGLEAEQTLGTLNRHLAGWLPDNRFVTMFYGVLDPQNHRLTYANAGHTSPLLLGTEGSCRPVGGSGMPLGIQPDQAYRAHSISLAPGHTLLGYSDGITEARTAKGEEFGLERLMEVARSTSGEPESIILRILEGVEQYSNAGTHLDDITLLALYRSP